MKNFSLYSHDFDGYQNHYLFDRIIVLPVLPAFYIIISEADPQAQAPGRDLYTYRRSRYLCSLLIAENKEGYYFTPPFFKTSERTAHSLYFFFLLTMKPVACWLAMMTMSLICTLFGWSAAKAMMLAMSSA